MQETGRPQAGFGPPAARAWPRLRNKSAKSGITDLLHKSEVRDQQMPLAHTTL